MRYSLRGTDRGLSPFAGVLLVVLTTFLLVGTAAMFVGDFRPDDQQQEAPSVTLSFEHVNNPSGNESVVITHRRGQKIHPGQMDIEVTDATCTGSDDPDGVYNAHEDFGLAEQNWMGAGMSIVIDRNNPEQLCEDGTLKFTEASVTVIWRNPSGNDVTLEHWGS